MTSSDSRVVLDAYRRLSMLTRLHVLVRSLTAPFDEIDDAVPVAGRNLEIGSGHGLLSNQLAYSRAGRNMLGVDIDVDKITQARSAAIELGVDDRVVYEHVEPDWLPPDDDLDAVVFADVLYLLCWESAQRLLRAASRAVGVGGVVIVKEMAERPRWKRLLTEAQEWTSKNVLRITQGQVIEIHPVQSICSALGLNGLEVSTVELDRGHLHPHVLIIGRRTG